MPRQSQQRTAEPSPLEELAALIQIQNSLGQGNLQQQELEFRRNQGQLANSLQERELEQRSQGMSQQQELALRQLASQEAFQGKQLEQRGRDSKLDLLRTLVGDPSIPIDTRFSILAEADPSFQGPIQQMQDSALEDWVDQNFENVLKAGPEVRAQMMASFTPKQRPVMQKRLDKHWNAQQPGGVPQSLTPPIKQKTMSGLQLRQLLKGQQAPKTQPWTGFELNQPR